MNWQKLDKKLLDRIQMLVKYFQSFITKGIDKTNLWACKGKEKLLN